ncbi:siderophore-interacting protein [Burkholderia cepacia]|nr:siderophore-interacting protein [Burkholderia vietnamiensis]MCA8344982.1 siderophore-interacting protein [Burkholderia cepacia]
MPRPRTERAVGTVQAVRSVTPHMQRITLGGSEVAEFLKVAGANEPAAWVKVFLPSGDGRAYTIQNIDFNAGTLDLDFVLHGAGGDSGPAVAAFCFPVMRAGSCSRGMPRRCLASRALHAVCLLVSTPRRMSRCRQGMTGSRSTALPDCGFSG